MRYLAILLMLAACKSKPIPYWGGKLFVGNSEKQGLERKQNNEFIPADSPEFDSYIAMSAEDFESFYVTYVLGCKDWGSKKLSLRPYKNNKDALKKLKGK